MSIAKFNQEIVENTHSKPQETLEFKMNKQKESFTFDVPLELPEQWTIGVTSLEGYNTVFKITAKNKTRSCSKRRTTQIKKHSHSISKKMLSIHIITKQDRIVLNFS